MIDEDNGTVAMDLGDGHQPIRLSLQPQRLRKVQRSSVASAFSSMLDDGDTVTIHPSSPSSSSGAVYSNEEDPGAERCFGIALPPLGSVLSVSEIASLSLRLKDQGNHLAESGDFSGAVRCWNSALGVDPENGILHELKAQVYMLLEEERYSILAVHSAQRAIELLPDWAEGHLTLAR